MFPVSYYNDHANGVPFFIHLRTWVRIACFANCYTTRVSIRIKYQHHL